MCRNPKSLPLCLGLVGLFLSAGTVCRADNTLGVHWPKDKREISIVDSTNSTFLGDLIIQSVGAWNALPTGLTLSSAPLLYETKVEVKTTKNRSILGQARLKVDGDHIIAASAKINEKEILKFADPTAVALHVICQEIGHDWGLAHILGIGSCMDNTFSTVGDFTLPTVHDAATILAEGHPATDEPVDDGNGGNGPPGGGGPPGRNRFGFTGTITHVMFADFSTATYYATAHSVPEPSTLGSAAVGLLGLLLVRRKQVRRFL